MAWPNTALTTYSAGTTPAIKAVDLNAFQSAINGIVNATYSLAAVVVDGTGGSVVTPVAGTLKPSAVASGTTAPTTAVPWGTCYRDQVLFGGAEISPVGAFVDGFNVLGVNYAGAGNYEITFHGQPTNINRCRVEATAYKNGGAVTCTCEDVLAAGADTKIVINTWTSAGVATDARFFVDVWGG